MTEETKLNIEEVQKSIVNETVEFLRTKINKEESKDIICALITINKVTGQILVNTINAPLLVDTKMLLQESLDMLNRQQLVNTLLSKIITQKGESSSGIIIPK